MMKKNVTGIVALFIGVALVLSFTSCNKNKKPAEVVEELEEELVEEIVEEAKDGKESSYDKLLKGDFSAFAGMWVDDTKGAGLVLTLTKNGSFNNYPKASDIKQNKDGSYTWNTGKDYSLTLHPAGVDVNGSDVKIVRDGLIQKSEKAILQSDKTKIRITCVHISGKDRVIEGLCYRPSDKPIQWSEIDTEHIVGTDGKYITTADITTDFYPYQFTVFSKDKKTWTLLEAAPSKQPYSPAFFAFGNDVFVATGFSHGQDSPPPPGNFWASYSKDGKKWTKADCPLEKNSSVGITFNKGNFVIDATSYVQVGKDADPSVFEGTPEYYSREGWTEAQYTATSKDGVTWKVDKKKGQGKGGGAKVDGEGGGKKRERDSDSEGGGGKKGGGKKGGDNKDKEQAPQGQPTNPDN